MALPTIWNLLWPNLNAFTIIGLFVLVVSLILLFQPYIKKSIALMGVAILVILIWGFSIVQDVWASLEGKIILLGILAVALTFAVLFKDKLKFNGVKN